MASRKAYHDNIAGFTLIEVMIAMGILGLLLGMGLFLGMDFYRGYLFRYERNLTVSLLEKSRSRAIANIHQTSHGITFNTETHEYIMFRGSSYNPSNPTNENIPANKAVEIIWPEPIIFEQLSGNCIPCSPTLDISLTHAPRTTTISINSQGAIVW